MSNQKFTPEPQLVEAYMRLADSQLERFNKSRDIEWKVNISFWTLILVSGGFLFGHCREIYAGCFGKIIVLCVSAVLLAVLALIHHAWLSLVQANQDRDRNLSFYFRNKALELLGEPHSNLKEEAPDQPWNRLAYNVTWTLAVAVLFFLIFKMWTSLPDRISQLFQNICLFLARN